MRQGGPFWLGFGFNFAQQKASQLLVTIPFFNEQDFDIEYAPAAYHCGDPCDYRIVFIFDVEIQTYKVFRLCKRSVDSIESNKFIT